MSMIVVVQLSGVPRVGGIVIGGSVGCILDVTNVSLTYDVSPAISILRLQEVGLPRLTSDVSRELLPTDSSPQMQIRTITGQCMLDARRFVYQPVAIVHR